MCSQKLTRFGSRRPRRTSRSPGRIPDQKVSDVLVSVLNDVCVYLNRQNGNWIPVVLIYGTVNGEYLFFSFRHLFVPVFAFSFHKLDRLSLSCVVLLVVFLRALLNSE